MMIEAPETISTLPRVLHRLKNAVVTPTVTQPDKSTFSGCVYDQDGRVVPASTRTSRNVVWKAENPSPLEAGGGIKTISGPCLYLGHYTTHYGHFLLETLARFWALEEEIPYHRVVFHPFIHSTPRFPLLRRLVRGQSPLDVCFKCFGIRWRKTLIVRRPLRFSELLVPSPLVEINNTANPEQAAVFRRIARYCDERWDFHRLFDPGTFPARTPLRLYLSRSKLKTWLPGRVTSNEPRIEDLFASFGFQVIHPQDLTFPQQVLLYSRAEALAGIAGSGMHNSVFLKKGALAISLGSPREGEKNNQNQIICDGLSQARSEFIGFQGKTTDVRPRIAEYDIDYLRDRLRAMGLEQVKGEPKHG